MNQTCDKPKCHTIPATALPDISMSPTYGVISIVGGHGGSSLITGEIYRSNLVPGAMAVETEHGVLYLDSTQDIVISEDPPA